MSLRKPPSPEDLPPPNVRTTRRRSAGFLYDLPTLTMPVVVALALLLFVGLYIYAAHEDLEKILIFVALITAGFGQIAVSFYTSRTLTAMIERDDREFERQKAADEMQIKRDALFHQQVEYELKKEALAFGARWNDPAMTAARNTLRAVMSHDSARVSGAVLAYAKENEAAVMHVVNFFEELATSVRMGLVHEEVARDQFDFVVLRTWSALTDYVRDVRAKEGNKLLWEDVEHLYDKWKKSR